MESDTPFFDYRADQALRSLRRIADALASEHEQDHWTVPSGVHYAIKANPHRALLETLHAAGSGFEVASPQEAELIASLGVDLSTVVHTNPVRSEETNAHALRLGIRKFVLDSPGELARLTAAAANTATPTADISLLVRLSVEQSHSRFPLGAKFGCTTDIAADIAATATGHGFRVAGVAFHTGSQSAGAGGFLAAGRVAANALDLFSLDTAPVVDLGGGWPVPYQCGAVPNPDLLVAAALDGLREHACTAVLIAEPGRFLAADAFDLVTTVTGTTRRGNTNWAYIDAGVYQGPIEPAFDPTFTLNVTVDGGNPDGCELVPWMLAGPTCDSVDVMGPVMLPAKLPDRTVLRIYQAGAYSLSTASNFNGFAIPDVRTSQTHQR
jgi:ornithine decarboxylase